MLNEAAAAGRRVSGAEWEVLAQVPTFPSAGCRDVWSTATERFAEAERLLTEYGPPWHASLQPQLFLDQHLPPFIAYGRVRSQLLSRPVTHTKERLHGDMPARAARTLRRAVACSVPQARPDGFGGDVASGKVLDRLGSAGADDDTARILRQARRRTPLAPGPLPRRARQRPAAQSAANPPRRSGVRIRRSGSACGFRSAGRAAGPVNEPRCRAGQ